MVELFTVAPAAAGKPEGFAATPAPLARIERQLAVAGRWASGPVVGFSLPDYMSGFGGAAATRLLDEYLRWVDGCRSRAH